MPLYVARNYLYKSKTFRHREIWPSLRSYTGVLQGRCRLAHSNRQTHAGDLQAKLLELIELGEGGTLVAV